jgi:hypothetical protein
LGFSASAIETPGERKPMLSVWGFGLDSANGVSQGQPSASKKKEE